uniref:Immunoglobulin domain-containing protein n=1 Tax=Sinocyclocheilus anshuiensis TaxID=1608454 RepID=A0A671NA02_9TELE
MQEIDIKDDEWVSNPTLLLLVFMLKFSNSFKNVRSAKALSVIKGEAVTLNTRLTQINQGDWIQWWFGKYLIVDTNVTTGSMTVYDDGLDGRFRDRLKLDNQTGSLTITNTTTEHSQSVTNPVSAHAVKSVSVMEGDSVSLQTNTKLQTENLITLKLDHQTGSLTITNTRNTHSGLYRITIIRSGTEKTYRFNIDSINAVKMVMEGDSVSLESGLTEIQTRDLITWTFGLSETLIAQIYKEAGRFSTIDGTDGRFRDRVKLDHQTGSLTITNTRNTDSGLYRIIFIRSRKTTYTFNVTVYKISTGTKTGQIYSILQTI